MKPSISIRCVVHVLSSSIFALNLILYFEAIERAGFDVKYVVMIRDFIRAINSVFRRGFSFTERFCHNMQLTTKEIGPLFVLTRETSAQLQSCVHAGTVFFYLFVDK
jgi:hypothetical protein